MLAYTRKGRNKGQESDIMELRQVWVLSHDYMWLQNVKLRFRAIYQYSGDTKLTPQNCGNPKEKQKQSF